MYRIGRKRFEWLKQKHYELWDWLAKNPDKEKWEWEGFKDIEVVIDRWCFACYFNATLSDLNTLAGATFGNPGCPYCPIVDNIGCDDGLYFYWSNSNDATQRTRLAELIRDLEWSDEYVRRTEE